MTDSRESVVDTSQFRRPAGFFSNGEWCPSSGSESFQVVNPATAEPCAEVSRASAADVDTAVRAAHQALHHGTWPGLSLDDRCEIVGSIRAGLAAARDELARAAAVTLGQPLRFARGLGGSLDVIDMCLESVRQVEFEYEREDRFGRSLITRRPVGVVAAIVPWNTPLRAEVKKVVPALLAGCTVVLKPAPETPFAAAILADVSAKAGLPPGVLNVVNGGADVGENLVSHPLVRKIAFTGSTATGVRIGEICSRSMKRTQLELGGKSAAVLLEDADPAKAIPQLVDANFRNTGQTCAAVTRILVHRSAYGAVCDAMVEGARAQVVGDPLDGATTVGPLVSSRQRDRVERYIERGSSEGSRLLAGGRRPAHLDRGWYIEPTVFGAVSNSMTIAQEEIFGPVASIIQYDTVAEAIELANDSPYGLHGSVFSADDDRALAVARQIDSGAIGINRYGIPGSTPFGGVKMSGIGREHGPEGYDSFLEYRSYGYA